MKKFYAIYLIDGAHFGSANTTLDGAKQFLADNPCITSCELHADDEWYVYSIEFGWEHHHE